jgi:hypothetical protein
MEQSYGVPAFQTKTICARLLCDRIIVGSKITNFKAIGEDGKEMKKLLVSHRGLNEGSRKNLLKKGDGSMSYAVRLSIRKAASIFGMGCVPSRSKNNKTGEVKWLRACFVTLTIPDLSEFIDAKTGYEKLIKKWLRWVIKRYRVKRYVWRFEWQGRGQGHWHLMLDRFVPAEKARAKWWALLKTLGMTKDFEKKHDFVPDQCCDIKGIFSETMLNNYLWQYYLKPSQSYKPTEGRWWGASECIKKSSLPILPVSADWDRHVEIARKAGRCTITDVDIHKEDIYENPFRGDSSASKSFRVCTVIKRKKGSILALLMPFQEHLQQAYYSAYRSSNWKLTRELAANFGEHRQKYGEFRAFFDEMKKDMAYLESLKVWPSCPLPYRTGIQRRNIKKRWEAEKTLSTISGVSLFTCYPDEGGIMFREQNHFPVLNHTTDGSG